MIRIEKFTKMYDDKTAVSNLDLHVEEGDIFGFIGPNGAGKTTTLRFLATLLEPTSGRAWICGHDVVKNADKVKRSMGFMPDHFGVYDGMKVWEFLDFFALAYGINSEKRRGIVNDLLELLDLTTKRDDLVNGLSRGMRQRLGLAKTLVHDPPILILDEPASGMDPRARIEIRELLKELRDMGKTILISSHILSELAGCCNKIGIIEKGTLVASGSIADILSEMREHLMIEVRVIDGNDRLELLLKGDPRVSRISASEYGFRFSFAGTLDEVAELHSRIVRENIPLVWFREMAADLEEVFLSVTKGDVA